MISSIEPKAFELVCYMVTSACNLLNENRLYGPFRLIDAASRLITLLEEEGVRSKRLGVGFNPSNGRQNCLIHSGLKGS
jgi:hypothetical protein